MPIEQENHINPYEEEEAGEIEEPAGQELEELEIQPLGSAVRENILHRFRSNPEATEAEKYQNAEKKVLYSMAAYAYITKNRNLITRHMDLIVNNQRAAAETQVETTVNFVIAHTHKIDIKVQESIDTIMENQVIRTPGIGRDNIVETLTREFHCMNEEEINELRSTIQNLNPEGCLALGLGTDDNEGHGYISVNLFDF